ASFSHSLHDPLPISAEGENVVDRFSICARFLKSQQIGDGDILRRGLEERIVRGHAMNTSVAGIPALFAEIGPAFQRQPQSHLARDRKSTRLNSSHT